MWEKFKEGFNFTINNPKKVFTAIIVFMLIIFTFIQAFIKMIIELINHSKIQDERIPLDIFGFKISLLSTQYDLVVNIFIAMILMYFHTIVTHYMNLKFGKDSIEEETPEKEETSNIDEFDYSGKEK